MEDNDVSESPSVHETTSSRDEDPVSLKSEAQALSSLSQTFVGSFENNAKMIKEKLDDVQKNQKVLIESLDQEKDKMTKNTAVEEIEAAMLQINHYRNKVIRIKKTMTALKENSYKLRKDALKLQQIKQRENMKREDSRHKQLAEDRSLEAQLSP